MQIVPHRQFKKKFKKLRASEKKKFEERIELFQKEPFHPILNNHSLGGKYKDSRSINITGNLRLIFEFVDDKTILLTDIDTHSNLYE